MKLNIQSIDWSKPQAVVETIHEWLETSPSREAMARVATVVMQPLIPHVHAHGICMTAVSDGVNHVMCNASVHRIEGLLYYLAKLGGAIMDPVGVGSERSEEEWKKIAFEVLRILSCYLHVKDRAESMYISLMTPKQRKETVPGSVVLMVVAMVKGVEFDEMFSDRVHEKGKRLEQAALTGARRFEKK